LAILGRFRCQKKQGAGIDQLGGFSRGHADQVLFSAVGDIQIGQALMYRTLLKRALRFQSV
jgi:hypothetical protein